MAEFKFDPSLRLNLELHGDTASRETSVCIVQLVHSERRCCRPRLPFDPAILFEATSSLLGLRRSNTLHQE
jgi:hypothetical protein